MINEQRDSSGWYLAASKPRQELRAVENLSNQQIKCYCPLITVEKISGGKKRLITEPMFSGYLFIRLSPEDGSWHKVRSTRGIRDWVRFGGTIARLPAELVRELIEQESKLANNYQQNDFKPGDRVTILSGPFQGLNGIFQAKNGQQRSMLLIDFLGKTNRLTIENDQIVAS